MQLKKFALNRKEIVFVAVFNPDTGDDTTKAQEERTVKAQEQALPELVDAFGKLPKVFCEAMGLPQSYLEGLSVNQLVLSQTKHGTRAVQLRAAKSLQTIGGQLHTIESPFVKIDPPADGESGEQQVSDDAREVICTAIHEAERYAKGDRSQQLIDFDKASAALNAQAKLGEDEKQTALL